jgi:hypothetical protein
MPGGGTLPRLKQTSLSKASVVPECNVYGGGAVSRISVSSGDSQIYGKPTALDEEAAGKPLGSGERRSHAVERILDPSGDSTLQVEDAMC